ncbi:mannose-6-phosphate isomerase, class I [Bacillus wiedmannii]|uniref:mannose-6-phosphate isomerase, class I n=1 Tax=Bacillus wiedmannii TaxID=1890302 RepID=UPI000BF07721|nr:mannose-6-phosphate isomerase, class I [Bacillus wiedmannii]PEN03978.1 mannose-6-phosphate isomerase, class I [Bacillus wiedmannii]PGB84950.1 mannose-6-phosphate isomerase, class I [Bacillus wiedmannii]
MYKEPLFFQPVLQERIWGGESLKGFNYDLPSQTTGECWGISAHLNGLSIVKSGKYKDLTLKQLWDEHRELFGNYQGDQFPLLTKILDAKKDLSVQVHPNDEFANIHENGELGKTECWYIIDCKKNAEMVYGHTAQTKEEFKGMIENNEWNRLLRRIPIKPGDFFYVPSGTIHALCEGTIVLETQQSSDTTYRVYDYDRIDSDGNKRDLHVEKSIAVSMIPHEDYKVYPDIKEKNGVVITKFVQEKYFSVYKWKVEGESCFQQNKVFHLVSVIDGEAVLEVEDENFEIKKGDHFIIPTNMNTFTIEGNITLIVSHP